MLNSLLGTKLRMTQVFDQDGKRWAATAIQAGPCTVTQIKNQDKDGYQAVQLSYGTRKRNNQPITGHLKKAGISSPAKYLREFKVSELDESIKPGASFSVKDIFQPGDQVWITGISKGKGFAGVMKRWGFGGGPRTHGQSDRQRAPGSIGAGTTPGRVVKGKKMAGRMGNDQVRIKGLLVLDIDSESNTLLVSGPVPGANQGLLLITKTGHDDRFAGLHQPENQDKQDEEQEVTDNQTAEKPQNKEHQQQDQEENVPDEPQDKDQNKNEENGKEQTPSTTKETKESENKDIDSK